MYLFSILKKHTKVIVIDERNKNKQVYLFSTRFVVLYDELVKLGYGSEKHKTSFVFSLALTSFSSFAHLAID